MSNRPKTVYERSEVVVDSATGDVMEQRTVTCTVMPREPNFIKVYFDTMKSFNGAHDVPTDVILAISQYITYASKTRQQQVYLPKMVKQQIGSELGVSVNMVEKYIRKMVEAGILFKSGFRCIYIVNPWLIAKGEWSNISKLRAEFDFNNNTWTYTACSPQNNAEGECVNNKEADI